MAGVVTRLSWRKCQKVAPSCSGFLGAPLGVVWPSATSPARASCHSLVCSAGRSSTHAFDVDGPGVALRVGYPGGHDDDLAGAG